MSSLFALFAARACLAADAPIADAVKAIPYGRPTSRTPETVIRQRRGACSTKHALLAALIRERWPSLRPRIIHHACRVDRQSAPLRHGPRVARAVPGGGLADVRRCLLISLRGRDVVIDATFPDGPGWDGREPMPLARGAGRDIPAGEDPDRDKAAIEARYCDPRSREPFIAALAAAAGGHPRAGLTHRAR